jgi:hypothetical protein
MLRLLTDEDVHDDMPGVLALIENIGIGAVLDDLLLVALCYAPEEIKDQVLYIPF